MPPISQPQIRDKRFLINARSQLDADHFGLDKIKRRLIEYLAVVRLKQLVADKEHKEDQEKMAAKAADQVTMKDGEGKDVQANRNQLIVPHQHHHHHQPLVKPQSRRVVKGPILLYVSYTTIRGCC